MWSRFQDGLEIVFVHLGLKSSVSPSRLVLRGEGLVSVFLRQNVSCDVNIATLKSRLQTIGFL